MVKTVKIDIDKVTKSYETISSIDSCVSAHNFHNYFFDMEDYIDKVNLKHDKCIIGYQDRIYEIIESIDKIKNKINLLNDSLKKTLDNYNHVVLIAEEQASEIQHRSMLETSNVNNDSSQEVIPVPKPTIEEKKKDGLFPEGYNTTPIGLGIAAAGVTASIGAVVIDSMTPKSYKKAKNKAKIEDDDINDYADYEIADEAEEKPIVSLKIDPSMTSYQAQRNHEGMKKFYDEDDEY